MRKKAYVENLEQTVQELSAAREALEAAHQKRSAATRARRDTWLRVLEVCLERSSGDGIQRSRRRARCVGPH